MKSNKIKNTKVGDDIHFYINGVEDRGIVVKMNNEYVTVFKESTQNYDEIHINDTFFVKDIMVNKEWDRCTDQERFDMLQKAHAPSPRYLMKSWDELPRDIKEVLRKNNGIETSHKETDDMNNVTRLNDEKTETNKVEKGFGGSERKTNPESSTSEDPEQAPDHKQGEKHRKETTESMDPHGIADEHGGKRGVTAEESAKLERHGASNVRNQERNNTGEKKEWEKFTGGRKDPALQGDKDNLKLIRGKISERKERKENQSDKVPKKVTEGVSALKAWEQWLVQRQEQVLKQTDDVNKILPALAAGAARVATGVAQGIGGAAASAADSSDDEVEKSIEDKLLELKSNVENSVHGNAARNPTAGVNTNTSFDAPKDYEGFSHSGKREEQFKYEDKKPSVGQKLSKVNIKIDGSDRPTKLAQGTGDNGNAYNTKQQNEQKQGRADNQEGDKKQ